ncbi:Hypothetical protein Tpal_513 [Trichococcus palustris]|uniref:Uncharacterized protein n=1 Tax=Trichococcus palustris TaxID=140314 RepID=A0A143YAJ2_9LACT|nr:hypothetical protein [Trichococcus palustris]CZQ84007.1 Hypothetical protein Tpal_513 [Trichococcus palustris]SFK71097.1 hypothetical protein SAMN04488076_103221 [Trichococcus palustris]
MIENEEYYMQQLHEQISFLVDSAHNYDRGNFAQAKMMSAIIRTLLKDPDFPRKNNKTVSLLKQLDRKESMKFFNTGFEAIDPIISINLVGMVTVPSKPPALPGKVDNIYLPVLEKSRHIDVKWLNFIDWWESNIIVEHSENLDLSITRKSIVLTMAEQDGGTHVDSVENVEINYLSLATATKSLFTNVDQSGYESPIINLHFALVRQIAHELIISISREFNLGVSYTPTNSINLRGVSENNIKQVGVFAEKGKEGSSRTAHPFKQMPKSTFTTPANAAYVKLFL